MSLLQLLTAGKSLVGLKKLEHRYHLPAQPTLPQFGSKKNPFRATVLPEKIASLAADASTAAASVAPPLEPSAEQESKACAAGAEVDPPKSEGFPNHSKPAPILPCSSVPVQRGSAFKAFLLWRRAKKPKSRPSSDRSLVQAELSLDGVRVVRNDLTESDLEVVPAGRASAVQAEETARARKPFAASNLGAAVRGLCGAAKM